MAGIASGNPQDKMAAVSAERTLSKAEEFEDGNEALIKFFQENHLLSEKDAKNLLPAINAAVAQTPSGKPGPSLVALLSDRGIASIDKCLALISDKTKIPYIPIVSYDVDANKAMLVDKDFCLRHLILPFDKLSKTLLVATTNPFDAEAKRQVEAQAEAKVQWYLAQPLDLTKQIKDVFRIQ